MVEQMTVGNKAHQPVSVRIVNLRAGDYKVLSTDGVTWYYVNVARIVCTCPAGAHGFTNCKQRGYCKHVAAAKYWAKVLRDREAAARAAQPAQTWTGAQGLLEAFGLCATEPT